MSGRRSDSVTPHPPPASPSSAVIYMEPQLGGGRALEWPSEIDDEKLREAMRLDFISNRVAWMEAGTPPDGTPVPMDSVRLPEQYRRRLWRAWLDYWRALLAKPRAPHIRHYFEPTETYLVDDFALAVETNGRPRDEILTAVDRALAAFYRPPRGAKAEPPADVRRSARRAERCAFLMWLKVRGRRGDERPLTYAKIADNRQELTATWERDLRPGDDAVAYEGPDQARPAHREWHATKSPTCEALDREQVREIITERSHPDLEFGFSVHWPYSIGITCPAREVATGQSLVKRLRQVLEQEAPIGLVAIANILGEPPITIQEALHRLRRRGKVVEQSSGRWRWKAQ